MSLKTLRNISQERKRKNKPTKRAQDIIPLTNILENGIYLSDNTYIKNWSFENINFKLLSKKQEENVFKKWFDTLNILEPGATFKYVIMKEKLDVDNYKSKRLIKYQSDEKDFYRKEYNEMLEKRLYDTKLISEKRFFQAAINVRKEREAEGFFQRTSPELSKMFQALGTDLIELNNHDYLKSIWNFFHIDSDNFFEKLELPKGKKVKSFLAPYSYEVDIINNCIKIDDKYMRALYIPPDGYAKYIKDTVIYGLTSLDKTMCIAVDIMPLETQEAYGIVETLEFRANRNNQTYQTNQAKRGVFDAPLPYNLRKKSEQIEEYNTDLNERDQRLMLSHITILHVADSIDELNDDTEILKSQARKEGCSLTELTLEQEKGLMTALPFGVNKFINKNGTRLRTLTTEAMASFIPFTVQEIQHEKGIYYGQNLISKTPIFIDRKNRMNGNAVIIGSSGSGKSFKKKEEQLSILLSSEDKIIIIDPEKEYTNLVKSMGGEVIKMSADSDDYINAMELDPNYNDGKDPIALKSESILTLYAMAENEEKIDAGAKSVIDRCVKNVCSPFVRGGYKGTQPTLKDLRNELLKQDEPVAKDIALTLELYTEGSLNLFSKQTNVDMNKKLISFDISELGDSLMPIAMLIITDFIMLTLSKNRKEKVYTWVDIDELYLMFLKEYTAEFFYKLWKRIRKYGGLCTGITQEIADLLKSPTARTLLANSDFLIMLSANDADAPMIQELLNLDDTQMSYIKDVGEKKGMVKLGKSFIPFTDDFPKDTHLYKMLSTKLKEE